MSRGYAAIGLINPKTDHNVGGVLRAAQCFDARLVAIQGQRYARMVTDTLASYRHIPVLHVEDILATTPFDCVPVAVEFVLESHARALPPYVHPERAFYIFGPEDGGVPPKIMAKCRDVVYIPTAFCMNLAATVNVLLYDRLVKRGA